MLKSPKPKTSIFDVAHDKGKARLRCGVPPTGKGAFRGTIRERAFSYAETVWPSGLRRWLKAPVRKGVGSNPTAVTSLRSFAFCKRERRFHA